MNTSQSGADDTSGQRPRIPNRWGEGQRLRQEILDAADRLLLVTSEPQEISLRAIAREAGVTASAVYKHFKDKSELLWAVLDGLYAELTGTMRAAARSVPDGDSWAALRAAVDAYCQFAVRHRQRYQLMFYIGPTLPNPRPVPQLPAKGMAECWHELVDAYLADPAAPTRNPALASMSPETASQLLWTGLHGQFGIWWSARHDLPEQIITDLRDGLLLALFGRC